MMRDNNIESAVELHEAEVIKKVVSSQMKAARSFRNLSVRKAAAKMSISPAYLSQIENGSRNISLDILFKASKVYEVSVDVLLGREMLMGNNTGPKLFMFIERFFSGMGNSDISERTI